jgi:hypothetical protein
MLGEGHQAREPPALRSNLRLLRKIQVFLFQLYIFYKLNSFWVVCKISAEVRYVSLRFLNVVGCEPG